MDRARALELLSQNAAILREDISLIDTGLIKLNVFGADVSQDHLARLKGNLARLDAILEAWEMRPPDQPSRGYPSTVDKGSSPLHPTVAGLV